MSKSDTTSLTAQPQASHRSRAPAARGRGGVCTLQYADSDCTVRTRRSTSGRHMQRSSLRLGWPVPRSRDAALPREGAGWLSSPRRRRRRRRLRTHRLARRRRGQARIRRIRRVHRLHLNHHRSLGRRRRRRRLVRRGLGRRGGGRGVARVAGEGGFAERARGDSALISVTRGGREQPHVDTRLKCRPSS